jgi:hypothetical protein
VDRSQGIPAGHSLGEAETIVRRFLSVCAGCACCTLVCMLVVLLFVGLLELSDQI